MSTLEEAIRLATELHAGQTDLGGHPYIEHPLWVMQGVRGTIAKTVAVLHDVLEDCDITAQELLDAGFSKKVVTALTWLTKSPKEPRIFYTFRISVGPRVALNVKITDLKHNIDMSRIPSPEEWHIKRIRMYKWERAFLVIIRLLRIVF